MLTVAGSGYSRWRDIAVTRWREDPTCDPFGCYIYLRDVVDGEVWSAGYQPVGHEPDAYEALFFEDRAQITRRDGSILAVTEILVSPDDNAEVRRVSLTNQGKRTREIELTSYAEVVLAPAAADAAHPAFSKLFVRTEFAADSGALLATRRSREPSDPALWLVHVSAVEGDAGGALQFETDRARFLGRGHGLRNAVSIVDARPLSGSVGTVLDPVLALRRRVRIAPGKTARVDFGSGSARAARRRLHWPISTVTWRPSISPSPAPAPRPKRSCAISASRSTRLNCFSAPPIRCCISIPGCERPARFSPRTCWGLPLCGRSEYPAMCPSCWLASTMRSTLKSSACCCVRAHFGDSKGWLWISSS